jgi:hypothetical protein
MHYQRSRTSSIGVYPVQPDGSRPRENVFTIYENKRICPKQSKFGVDEQSLRDAGYHRRTVALTGSICQVTKHPELCLIEHHFP